MRPNQRHSRPRRNALPAALALKRVRSPHGRGSIVQSVQGVRVIDRAIRNAPHQSFTAGQTLRLTVATLDWSSSMGLAQRVQGLASVRPRIVSGQLANWDAGLELVALQDGIQAMDTSDQAGILAGANGVALNVSSNTVAVSAVRLILTLTPDANGVAAIDYSATLIARMVSNGLAGIQ